jgi:hypothetical protein
LEAVTCAARVSHVEFGARLEVAALLLLALEGLEEGLEVAHAEAP